MVQGKMAPMRLKGVHLYFVGKNSTRNARKIIGTTGAGGVYYLIRQLFRRSNTGAF